LTVTSEKKVLIITYYWPPSGGSGVQRWLKFVKYLPTLGWQPFVFTPQNPSFQIKDESLLADVPNEAEIIHFPIWEPYTVFEKISAVLGSSKSTDVVSAPSSGDPFFKKLSTWIRGNLFIPDPRRFWINPSVKFLSSFLEANDIRILVTTGPPHSMHLIGYKLKKQNPKLKWIADFRDPWSEWGFLDTLRVSKPAKKIHQKLERQVLQTADVVTTITPFYVKHFERLGARAVHLISNGFDDDDFKSLSIKRTDKFLIRHVGIINEKCDPRPLLLAIEKLISSSSDFAQSVQVEFIGKVYHEVVEFVNTREALKSSTVFIHTMPHKELLALYGSSSLLLLILTGYKDAEGYMPGKLYEYIATGLPVLGVGPEDGDAAKLLKETGNGLMIHGDNQSALQEHIMTVFSNWQNNSTDIKTGTAQSYSRSALTRSLVRLFES
jgi:glycosyltransferase involved in cell wall biosynthesis